MRILKKWSTYQRNGIIYVQFKDKITGKRITAKSTGTRIKAEADEIIQRWYHDPDSFFNQQQKKQAKNQLADIIKTSCLNESEITEVFQSVFSSLWINAALKPVAMESIAALGKNSHQVAQNAVVSSEPEIQMIVQKIDTLTFTDYLFWYFEYDTSPHILYLKRNGKKLPERERYDTVSGIFNHYRQLLPSTRLVDITAIELNTLMGAMKTKNNLSDATMCNIKKAMIEALHFVGNNGIMDISFLKKLTKFSAKSKQKEIFSQSELRRIFDKKQNVFGEESFFLVNKLLFATGCRIGEVLALQIQDIHKTVDGYKLYVGKSYNFKSWRLKGTKTNREDYIPISDELAGELFKFIEKNPFRRNNTAFIFYSDKKNIPLNYYKVQGNFERTMKNIGIKRKNLTLHSYRHTFTTILQDADYSDTDLLYITRHATVDETRRYSWHMTHAKEIKKREAALLIERFI